MVSSTEVPEQVVDEEREERSLGFSSSIVLRLAEQPEVNHRYQRRVCDLSCLMFIFLCFRAKQVRGGLVGEWEGGRWGEG